MIKPAFKNALSVCMLVMSTGTFASGIPVVDAASITQIITEGAARAAEFKQALDEAQKRLNQMKNQAAHYKSMVDGHFNYEAVTSDIGANQFMTHNSWEKIYNDGSGIASLRKQYGLVSDNPAIQAGYDNHLKQYRFQEKIYDSTVARNGRLKSLMGQFSNAKTPAAKADIANAIGFEQLQLENDNRMIASMTALMEKQKRFEVGQRARESIRIMLNEGYTRPKAVKYN